MKFKISALIFPILIISQVLFSQNNQYKPDSVVYIKTGSFIIITTRADTSKSNSQKYSNPSSPAAPIIIQLDSAVQIQITIKDSTYSDFKLYKFDAKTPGEYRINAWAFYENLPPGKYTCIIEYPGKLIRQKFVKIE